MAVCGSLWEGRSWQTKAEPGTASAIFLKSRRFEDIKYDTRDMFGASTELTMGDDGQQWATMDNNV